MRSFYLFLCLFITTSIIAQIPQIGISDKKMKPLQIADLSIDVEIVGNMATTTFEIDFYNPNRRILQGELSMPLKNGQEISRYALDVNGKLREGVIVEKVKARQAYEAVVRQKIDPGIITKTKGNSFNTKIYPIPAKGYKKLVLALTETLNGDEENLYYTLPFGTVEQMDKFELQVKVVNSSSEKMNITSGFQNIKFDKKEEAYFLEFEEKDFKPTEDIKFTIPRKSIEEYDLFTYELDGEQYFYLNFKPKDLQKKKREEPKTIGIYWDNSFSASKRDLEKEYELIQDYLSSLKTEAQVSVFHFNYSMSEPRLFSSSQSSEIINYLESLYNDGASRFSDIELSDQFDVILMFSDGVNTIGKAELSSKKPVFAINSAIGSDYGHLKRIASNSKGAFIDLSNTSLDKALDIMQQDQERFLSAQFKKSQLKEVYPKHSQSVNGYFEVVGVLKTDEAQIEVQFGDSKSVTQSKIFTIKPNSSSAMVPRIWATKKIAWLDNNYEKNKKKILKLSHKHHIITKNTSMLVLDRVEDYVQHQIIPPQELRKEYDRLIEKQKKPKKPNRSMIISQNQNRIQRLFRNYMNIPHSENISNKQTTNTRSDYEPFLVVYDSLTTYNGSGIIEGVLVDKDSQEPIPFASIVIESEGATVSDTNSDFDGNFRIIGVSGFNSLFLKVTSVGFVPQMVDISNGYPEVIKMESSDVHLDEYVVIDYDVANDDEMPSMPNRNANSVATTVGGVFSEDGDRGSVRGARSGRTNNDVIVTAEAIDRKGSNNNSSIQVLAWMPDAEYMKELRKANASEYLSIYQEYKEENKNRPAFYIQVSDFLFKKEMHHLAVQILTNTIEMDLENPELLKLVARRLLDEGEMDAAIAIYEEIKELRPEEPQSYRDLALAYQRNQQYQEALDMFIYVLNHKWQRFEAIKDVVFNEMNALIALHKDQLDLSEVHKEYIKEMPYDIRITIDWSSNDNDIDLWVVDPANEKCYYGNKSTKIGGRISKDFTNGYGPEEFVLKKAKRGFYTVYVDYFSESRQTITGPVTVYAELSTHFGTEKQQTKRIAVQLKEAERGEGVQIGQLEFSFEE